MSQLSIPWALTGPDGTRAVLGNSDAARADPDWVAWLDPDNPPSIVRAIRGSDEPLVEGDGAVPGNRWRSGATIVINGVFDAGSSMTVVNALEQKLKRATRAFRSDGQLRCAPDGFPERILWFRRESDIDPRGRRPKTFQVQLASVKPFWLSPTESSVTIVPGAAAGEIGFSSPITDPISSPGSVAGQQFAVNAGDIETWPRFRVAGPVTNPRIVNNTTGEEIRLTYTLAAGEWLDVFPERGRVLLGGVSDRYSAFDRQNSRWWQLRPGSNDIRLLATSYSAGASLTAYWRHAWE